MRRSRRIPTTIPTMPDSAIQIAIAIAIGIGIGIGIGSSAMEGNDFDPDFDSDIDGAANDSAAGDSRQAWLLNRQLIGVGAASNHRSVNAARAGSFSDGRSSTNQCISPESPTCHWPLIWLSGAAPANTKYPYFP